MIDRFDEVVGELFEAISEAPDVMIGTDNPFGENMASILVKYRLPSNHIGLLGLVGPMRMDYATNLQLISCAKEALDRENDMYDEE